MKCLLVAVLLVLAGCESTRSNDDKGIRRPTYCVPVDRCTS
jgi:hypothetical protein